MHVHMHTYIHRPVSVAERVECPPPVLGDRGFESGTRWIETWSSQTKDFKINTCRILA